jgi:hypothetical protein
MNESKIDFHQIGMDNKQYIFTMKLTVQQCIFDLPIPWDMANIICSYLFVDVKRVWHNEMLTLLSCTFCKTRLFYDEKEIRNAFFYDFHNILSPPNWKMTRRCILYVCQHDECKDKGFSLVQKTKHYCEVIEIDSNILV